jgi:hypothetical protein
MVINVVKVNKSRIRATHRLHLVLKLCAILNANAPIIPGTIKTKKDIINSIFISPYNNYNRFNLNNKI